MRRILVFSVVLSLMLLGGAGPVHAATITVEADDNEFIPEEVTAQEGDTIVFENVGAAPHIATASDGSFDTGNLNAGESAEVTVDEEGTIEYVCSYHLALGMEGVIVVEAAAGAPAAEVDTAAGAPAEGTETDEGAGEEDAAGAGTAEEGGETADGEGEAEAGGGTSADEEPAEEEDVVPTQKYFPPLGVGLFVLMLLGLAPAVKEFLIPAMTKSRDEAEPEPVGAPPSLAVTATAPPAAALNAAPQAAAPAAPAAAAPAAAAPAAAPAAPAKEATSAVPATQAPTPGPTDPPLDPEKVYQAVMADETEKGTEPSVAEARAKAAKGRAEEALEMSKAPAEAPTSASAAAPASAGEAPAAEPPAPAAPPAAPAAPAGPKVSDEEAAAIRAKVQEEELAKGSDPRVAEGRAKAAEARAKKGTSGPQ